MGAFINDLMAEVMAKNPAQPEFHQAVEEVAESLELVIEKHPEYPNIKEISDLLISKKYNMDIVIQDDMIRITPKQL